MEIVGSGEWYGRRQAEMRLIVYEDEYWGDEYYDGGEYDYDFEEGEY